MSRDRDTTYDLDGLCQAAARLLAEGPMPEDQRAAAIPDGRTVRYYQSLGVVDRPLRYDGRTAVYGWRHLLQVVATKRLQTAGYSLAQIQQSLAGRATEQLETAILPASPVPVPVPVPETDPASPPVPESAPASAPVPPAAPAPAAVPESAPASRPLVSAEVAPGVIVTIDPARVPDPNAVLSTVRHALLGGLP